MIFMIEKASAQDSPGGVPKVCLNECITASGGSLRASFVRFLPPRVLVFHYLSTVEYWYFRGIELASLLAEEREAGAPSVHHDQGRKSATTNRGAQNPSCPLLPVTPANGGLVIEVIREDEHESRGFEGP